jgi:hypothetical protein
MIEAKLKKRQTFFEKQKSKYGKEKRANMDSMRVAKISLQNDIYSLAYAAFLDPDQLDKSVPGGLQPIRMNEEEVMNIFIAAIMVIGC